ncbi:MAG: hypothetical protein HFI53_11275 [Lachnospiraceae bacterium]|nr:hypothetical protein [Lachnospiraceae bacterium]
MSTYSYQRGGGDFYDFFLVDQDHLALVIADAHGLTFTYIDLLRHKTTF